jgi:uncharacterized membrane protein YgdD (TMEM256/DUF423 family)
MNKGIFWMLWGAFFIFLAVLLGAFGAHGLKPLLSAEQMQIYKTGIEYQLFHGLGLIVLGSMEQKFRVSLSNYLILLGIVLFSGNCYLYAISQVKLFAILIPFGGISLLGAWFLLSVNFYKLLKAK